MGSVLMFYYLLLLAGWTVLETFSIRSSDVSVIFSVFDCVAAIVGHEP